MANGRGVTTVVVLGGTGNAGRAVVREALARGLTVRVLSRHVPEHDDVRRVEGAAYVALDVLGDGTVVAEALDGALAGADAVIDASNGMGPGSMKVFTTGAERLAAAARRAGVGRISVLSIANVDKADYAYYEAHVAQERTYLRGAEVGGVPVTVVRATQFHDFLELFFGRDGRLGRWARLGLLPVPRGTRFQSIDLSDVARALVDAALEDGPARTWTVGGPEVLDARDMAQRWRRVHGSRRPVVAVQLPGGIGAFFRAGLNLVPDARYGTVTYDEWLAQR
ncbi:SDR family oxidoreductase [Luteimicrobium sp. NPDC057192]|uniref:SDR family oxidoreductase n=1 Tax=Luteimicrobium sp. NPDC057192 TaxID=3346042 RepID=UPI00363B0DE3